MRDLDLLSCELTPGVDTALSDALASGVQLALGATDERLGAHAREHLQRDAQLVACVAAPALAPQPLAVEEVGARELEPNERESEPLDPLAVQVLGAIAVAEQGARARSYTEGPLRAARAC